MSQSTPMGGPDTERTLSAVRQATERVRQQGAEVAAVNEALREFIQRRRQLEFLELFGTVEFEPDYDHKKGRSPR